MLFKRSTNRPPGDIQEFIAQLRARGEICEVTAEVDPRLELAEVHRRVVLESGPALLFKRVRGSQFPVITNMFGTTDRVDLAFGSDPLRFMKQVVELPHTLVPPTLSKLWSYRELAKRLFKVGTSRSTSSSAVKGVIQKPARATELPLLTTWPLDGGPFVTLPLVYTEHPETKVHNLGMYRIQRYNDTELGLHCQIGKGGGFHLKVAEERGQKLPVNVFIGGPPALVLSAIAPLPENVPELLFCSFVLGERLKMTSVNESPLPLCAKAEFVLVGEVDPKEMRAEGPFGDHYGYYSLKHDYPVLRLKSIYHRKNAVYPATVVGKPPQEDFFLGEYLQKLLSPIFPLVMPGVIDLLSYGDTGFHALAAARVKERYKREAFTTALRILGEGQLGLTKFLIIVDQPVTLKNFKEVLKIALERCQFETDLYILGQTSMDTLDYTGPKVNEGSKGILLGVGEKIRDLPESWHGTLPRGITDAKVFCAGCLVLTGADYQTNLGLPAAVAEAQDCSSWPLVIIVDNARETCQSERLFLWSVFMRFNPATDITAKSASVAFNRVGLSAPIVIDARTKPWYPAVVEVDPETSALVDRRWREYFPSRNSI